MTGSLVHYREHMYDILWWSTMFQWFSKELNEFSRGHTYFLCPDACVRWLNRHDSHPKCENQDVWPTNSETITNFWRGLSGKPALTNWLMLAMVPVLSSSPILIICAEVGQKSGFDLRNRFNYPIFQNTPWLPMTYSLFALLPNLKHFRLYIVRTSMFEGLYVIHIYTEHWLLLFWYRYIPSCVGGLYQYCV